MKYYTEIIPVALAEKLKEKGMPLGSYVWMPNGMASRKDEANLAYFDDQLIPYCTYAEVFDWLMGEKVRITLHTYPARSPFAWGYRLWTMDGGIIFDPNPAPEIMKLDCYPSFHEAANAAIEKALELIKED